MRKCSVGLTLVELLVVVVIIAILAGLITTAARSAIASSKASGCLSNLSQLGKAFELYANDNNGYVPPFTGIDENWQPDGINHTRLRLKTALKPYLSEEDVFFCPADANQKKNLPRHGFGSNIDSSYMLTGYYSRKVAYSGPLQTFPLSAVVRAADFPVLSDAFVDLVGTGTGPHEQGRFNWLFADGHVKSYPKDSFLKALPDEP